MSDIAKWDPFKHVTRLYEDIDNLFTEFLRNFSQECHSIQTTGTNFTLDVQETGDEIVITGQIPGAVKDSIDVSLRPDSVVISGESSHKLLQNGAKEFTWSKFTRMTALPVKVRSEDAKVTFEEGKIMITVPKDLK